MYTQVEFLANQLEEKDLLIRTLIIRDGELQTQKLKNNNHVITHKSRSETPISESDNSCNESVFEFPIGEMLWNNASTVNENIDCNQNAEELTDEDFNNLYLQFISDTEEERVTSDSLDKQLHDARVARHYEFCHAKGIYITTEMISILFYVKDGECFEAEPGKPETDDKVPWPTGTVLVLSDSTLNGVQEELMGPRFKVRSYSGSIIRDFYHNAIPLLEKLPTYVILMAGTNDVVTKHSEVILVEILKLKSFIENELP